MPIPGYSQVESGSSWQSTVPGWVRPAVNVDVTPPPLRVTLDGLTLETGYQGSKAWSDLESIEGWWEGPETRAESMPIPDGDGELAGRVLLGARPIAVTGSIRRRDRASLIEAMGRYGSVLARSRYGTLTVEEADLGLSRQCRVRLAQPSVVVPQGPRDATIAWFLRAADPIRYADAESSVTLTNKGPDQGLQNTGNAPVKIGLELTGPLVTPSFWIGGAEWRLTYTIPAGRKVIVTWGDRSVMYGNDDLRYYQSGPWPLLQPGMNMVGFSAVSGTGTCKVIWRSGWL